MLKVCTMRHQETPSAFRLSLGFLAAAFGNAVLATGDNFPFSLGERAW